MQPDELDLISKDEAPILETMRSIYSAIPMHHLAAIHGKIAGAMIVANAVMDALPLIHRPVGCAFQRKLNLINSPTQRNAKKLQEMAGLLTQRGIKINKICFDHTTTKDMMDLARADDVYVVTSAD
ncbi:MAG: hypothetical protein PHS80_03040 [Methanothrix sp.]|nr:hypothetical protein [Methanothrix sp.]